MRRYVIFVSAIFCLGLMSLTPSMADPLLYLDFDNHPDATLLSGQTYTLQTDELATSITGVYVELLGSGANGVDIKVPDGDGINLPASSGPQGGKAMIIESGGKEEGFNFEMSSAYPIGDYTVEVCFWTATNNIAGNTVGLQDIWSSDWPTGDVLTNCLRIIGNAGAVGRPQDDRHLEMVCWQANGAEIRIVSLAEITPRVWHTAQFVFDYNEIDPANCTFYFYLDGVLQGSATYNAAITGGSGESFRHFWGVMGTPVTGARTGIGAWRFGLGCSMNRLISGIDNRGLQGATDAFCISAGALTPDKFVLPGGWSPPVPTPIPTPTPVSGVNILWQLFE